MKHILNNLTEVEKNAIREQHSGGMKVNTEKFNLMVEKKLGEVKPLVNEQVKTLTVGSKGGAMINPGGNRPGHFDFVVKKVLGSNKYMVTISKWEFGSDYAKVGDSGTLTVGNKDASLKINGEVIDQLLMD
jgi:hypothetical protein